MAVSLPNIKLMGKNLDASQEHELFPECRFGFVAKLTYRDDSYYYKEHGEKEVTYNNITEVHYAYDGYAGHDRCAFESDIHGTGGTVEIAQIESLLIECASQIYDDIHKSIVP